MHNGRNRYWGIWFQFSTHCIYIIRNLGQAIGISIPSLWLSDQLKKFKLTLYLYNEKSAILFVEIYRKDGVFV